MITDNLRDLHRAINGYDAQLIAVSKKQSDDKIEAALAAGHRVFGENRVQEAQEHWSERKNNYPDIVLHLIGSLQTNKVKAACDLFDVIHTLDREKLAQAIHTYAPQTPCFIQVNTGAEDQKSGILVSELEDFKNFCVHDLRMTIIGLMGIPPIDDPAGLHFGLLRQWGRRLRLNNLSMGMSGDYPLALKYGATHIRVGSALFGQRKT